jgi:uncharacterized protein (TIGR03089 family)
MTTATPATLLDDALRADSARVLLTFHDDATGERAELSVLTFANWVAKTANLCRDDLGLDVGARVAIALPLHWQAAVWWQVCWVSGFVGVPVPPGTALPACEAAVVALDEPAAADLRADLPAIGDVVGLGLGPMGLPVAGRAAPPGVTVDYDREVHAHGDRFVGPSGLTPAVAAFAGRDEQRSAGELATSAQAAAASWGLSGRDRVLLATAYDDLRALLAGLLVPLSAGCAAVLCRHLEHLDDAAFARRVATEGVTAVTGLPPRFLGSQARHLD